MWEHPLHFPLAAWTAVTAWGDRLWPELIGILGWQDVLLPPWTYFVLTFILLLVPLQKLNLDGAVRARVAVITGLGILAYIVTVYLIFFLNLHADQYRSRPGRTRTLLRHCSADGCHLPRLDGQRRSASWCTSDGRDCWILAFRNYVFLSAAGSALVGALNAGTRASQNSRHPSCRVGGFPAR
jgi:hypothetical protein